MKLLIVAAFVSVAAAGRLEHLERGYLPPNQSHGGFGSQGQSFGSQGSFGSGSFGSGFDSNAIDSASPGSRSQGLGSSAYQGATSNQYLPPNHGPSGSNGPFSGSQSGFQRSQPIGGSRSPNQYGSASNGLGRNQYHSQNTPNQYGSASNARNQYQQQYSGSQFPSSQQQYSGSQSPATSRQYLAPERSSFQNIPQQAFDEQTGYHY